MGIEIDLLINYPKAKRNLDERALLKTEEHRKIARKFGKEFFDGDRSVGYGGFKYIEKYWRPVIPTFANFYNITDGFKILDVGCAKGFMIYEFYKYNSNLDLSGIDISKYAIDNSLEEVKNYLKVADSKNLPFDDNSFDLVISINTIHNLGLEDCKKSLKEIERVSKKYSFITVDAYRNQDEKKRMEMWNLTAQTILSVEDWISTFKEVGYKGDYFWFIP